MLSEGGDDGKYLQITQVRNRTKCSALGETFHDFSKT